MIRANLIQLKEAWRMGHFARYTAHRDQWMQRKWILEDGTVLIQWRIDKWRNRSHIHVLEGQ